MIDLPRSTFYYRSTATTPGVSDERLVELIDDIQDEFPGYGYRRATLELRRRGHLVIDIGIELGKLLYWNGPSAARECKVSVVANRARLALLGMLLGAFFGGSLIGAWAFSRFGYVATVPLAFLLALVAAIPAWDDLSAWRRNEG